MHMKFSTPLVAAASFLALSACMGTDVSGGSSGPSIDYKTLTSTANNGTSTLGGTAVRYNTTANTVIVNNLSGSADYVTGSVTVDDGTYSLTDSNGVNDIINNSKITDGTSTITEDPGTSTYDYVTYFRQTYSSGGNNYSVVGQVGIVTATNDVPTSGSASYSGEAWGRYVPSGGSLVKLNSGTSSVQANFSAGTVDATLSNFTAYDGSNNPTTSLIDTIKLTGMQISGNTFGGGAIQTSNGGSTVDLVGANASGYLGGNFYGYDTTNNIPDEIGASMVQSGDSGFITADFIAD